LPSTDVEPVRVGVLFPALPLEGAEVAVHEADVGEVDVAVDDVGDVVAHVLGADVVGRADERQEVVAVGFEEPLALFDAHLATLERGLEDAANVRRRAARGRGPAARR
jgi:hypothetical protein